MKAALIAFSMLAMAGCAESLESGRATMITGASDDGGGGSPVSVSGIIDGKRFDFQCMSSKALNRAGVSASSVVYGASGDIFVSCENAALGMEANTLIAKPVLGANEGRVALTFRQRQAEDGRLPNVVSSDVAYVEIKEWNVETRRVRGRSKMWWRSGEVDITYDVSARM